MYYSSAINRAIIPYQPQAFIQNDETKQVKVQDTFSTIEIPFELWKRIFHLTEPQNLNTLCLVNHHFHLIITDPVFQKLFFGNFISYHNFKGSNFLPINHRITTIDKNIKENKYKQISLDSDKNSSHTLIYKNKIIINNGDNLQIWNIKNFKLEKTIAVNNCANFMTIHDDKLFFCVAEKGIIDIIDLANENNEIKRLEYQGGHTKDIVFYKNIFFALSSDCTVFAWDLKANYQKIELVEQQRTKIFSMQLCGDMLITRSIKDIFYACNLAENYKQISLKLPSINKNDYSYRFIENYENKLLIVIKDMLYIYDFTKGNLLDPQKIEFQKPEIEQLFQHKQSSTLCRMKIYNNRLFIDRDKKFFVFILTNSGEQVTCKQVAELNIGHTSVVVNKHSQHFYDNKLFTISLVNSKRGEEQLEITIWDLDNYQLLMRKSVDSEPTLKFLDGKLFMNFNKKFTILDFNPPKSSEKEDKKEDK